MGDIFPRTGYSGLSIYYSLFPFSNSMKESLTKIVLYRIRPAGRSGNPQVENSGFQALKHAERLPGACEENPLPTGFRRQFDTLLKHEIPEVERRRAFCTF